MYPSNSTQIVHLKVDKTFKKVSNTYINFAKVFSLKLALSMAEFVYNNMKFANIGHIPFKLNYGYHL